jgi:AcrR family transcriptional regulator
VEPHHIPSSRERIVAAARVEVEAKGILGLRVQDVAQNAKVSVPLIYKYFVDRDGLLAEVLGEMFEEYVLEQLDASEAFFNALESPTVDDILAVLALPQQDFRRPRRWQRMQILAASMEIPALRTRLSLVQNILHERLVSFMENAIRRITNEEPTMSCAALAMLLQSYGFGFVLNDLLEEGGGGVTDEQFVSLMRAMLNGAMGRSNAPAID